MCCYVIILAIKLNILGYIWIRRWEFSLRNFIKLKYLFISVIALAFILSALVSMYSNYQGNVKLMQEQTLENNRVYALKLSETIDKFISDTIQIMRYSATEIAYDIEDTKKLQKEADRLYLQGDTFSSVLIVDAKHTIIANSPQTLDEVGKKVKIKEGIEELHKRQPFISDPYISPNGQKVIVVSMPIYNDEETFKGTISGVIYLQESNILNWFWGNIRTKMVPMYTLLILEGKLSITPIRNG